VARDRNKSEASGGEKEVEKEACGWRRVIKEVVELGREEESRRRGGWDGMGVEVTEEGKCERRAAAGVEMESKGKTQQALALARAKEL
jgi:hypothetical protein